MSKVDMEDLRARIAAAMDSRAKPASVEAEVNEEIAEAKVVLEEGYKFFSDVFGFDPTPYIGFDVPVRVYTGRENVPERDDDYEWQRPELASFALGKYMGHKVFLSGPPGTGKSTLSEQFAAWTGKSYHRENMTTSMEPDELFGRVQIRNKDGASVTEFVPTQFIQMIQEPCEITIDEVFAARPALLQALQRVFEKGGVLRIPDGDLTITPHPECTWTLTDNTKGDGDNLDKYASRNVQDSSLLNRIEMALNINYLDAEVEERLVSTWAPSLPSKLVKDLVQFANLVRAAYQKGDLSKTFSPRQLKSIAQTSALCRDPKLAITTGFLNMLNDDEAAAARNFLSTVGL